MERKSPNLEEICIHLEEFKEAKLIEKKSEGPLLDHYYHAGCYNCSGFNKGCNWYINKTMKEYIK